MLLVPEQILLDYLQKLLAFVRTDYIANPNNSFLQKITTQVGIERYDYFTQAKKVFLAPEEDLRHLTVDLMYNMDIDTYPSIYITLPSESSGDNGIGFDEGFAAPTLIQNPTGTPDIITPAYSRRFNANYSIMVVSDNSNEVVMIYHILRALMIGGYVSLHLAGLENITFGGQDVQLNSDLIPKNVFMKAITIGIQYQTFAPTIHPELLAKDIITEGKATGLQTDLTDTPNNTNDL